MGPETLEERFFPPKIGFFEFKKTFGRQCSLNFFYNENFYYYIFSTNFYHKSNIWEEILSLRYMLFYKQHQAEIDKNLSKSNTLRLNFYYLKIIPFLHPLCHPKL